MSDYKIVNLKEVEDQAPNFGLSPELEARFARVALEAELIGLTYQGSLRTSGSRSGTSTRPRKRSTSWSAGASA